MGYFLIVSEITAPFIILKKTKYQEADLIIQALSQSGNKKSFIAKSALRSKKRFGGGVLEPTHFVQFTYTPSKNGTGLNVLNEASVINDFKNIRTDYDKIEFALNIMNCVTHVSQEGDFDSHFLYNLVGHSLKYLERCDMASINLFKMHFYLKFLYQQGVISLESWMNPFLKTNIVQSETLILVSELNVIVDSFLSSIELQVKHYIKSADSTLG